MMYPLTPKLRDQHQFSRNNINTQSIEKAIRIDNLITKKIEKLFGYDPLGMTDCNKQTNNIAL